MCHLDGNNTPCNFLLADNLINPGSMEIRDTRPGRNVAFFPSFFFYFNYTFFNAATLWKSNEIYFRGKSIGNNYRGGVRSLDDDEYLEMFFSSCLTKFNDCLRRK